MSEYSLSLGEKERLQKHVAYRVGMAQTDENGLTREARADMLELAKEDLEEIIAAIRSPSNA